MKDNLRNITLPSLPKYLAVLFQRPYVQLALLLALLWVIPLSSAQTVVAKELDLNTLSSIPAVIEVSPDFLTIIEFEGMSVESVQSGRPDQLVIQPSDNIITIRAATQADQATTVNTDLFILVGGHTALFKLVSAPDAETPRRYVVRAEKTLARSLQGNSAPGGISQSDNAETPPPPPGIDFKISAFRPGNDAVIVQYTLTNNTKHTFVNDPLRLRVYQDGVTTIFERTASPVPGRPGRLLMGESELGQLVIPGVPANIESLELEWMLVEIGPGTVYRASSDLLVALGEKIPDLADIPRAAPTLPPIAAAKPLDALNKAASAKTGPNVAPNTVSTEPGASATAGVAESKVSPEFSAEVAASTQRVKPGEEVIFDVAVTTQTGRLEGGLLDFEVFDSDNVSVEQQVQPNLVFTQKNLLTQTFTWTPQKAGTYQVRVGVFRDDWAKTFYWNDKAAAVTVAADKVQANRVQANRVQSDASAAAPSGEAVNTAKPVPTPGTVLVGSDFEDKGAAASWQVYSQPGAQAERIFEKGEACTEVSRGGDALWSVGFQYFGFPLVKGQDYSLRFDAYADKPVDFRAVVSLNKPPWDEFFGQTETLGTQRQSFGYTFAAAQGNKEQNRLVFFVGENQATPYRICFDNIELTEIAKGASADTLGTKSATQPQTAQTLLEEHFDNGEGGTLEGWWVYEDKEAGANATYVVENGEACVDIGDSGKQLWHVGFGHSQLTLETGQTYALRFNAYADKPITFYPTVDIGKEPWTKSLRQTETLSPQPQPFGYTFRALQGSKSSRLVFSIGNNRAPYRICFDNIELARVTEPADKTAAAEGN